VNKAKSGAEAAGLNSEKTRFFGEG